MMVMHMMGMWVQGAMGMWVQEAMGATHVLMWHTHMRIVHTHMRIVHVDMRIVHMDMRIVHMDMRVHMDMHMCREPCAQHDEHVRSLSALDLLLRRFGTICLLETALGPL